MIVARILGIHEYDISFDLNESLILDSSHPFGPQIQKPLSEIDLKELIKLESMLNLPKDC